MSEMPVPPEIAELTHGELVDDHSLVGLEGDEFRHADFVSELAGVVMHAEMPANVALFGPWGSGKSGIANLLKAQLPSARKQARFALFDASKYAETPLRRHFISQVASALEIDDEKFHAGLYTAVDDNKVTFGRSQWLSFVKLVGVVAVGVGVGVAVLAGAWSLVSGKPFIDLVDEALFMAVPGAAVCAALLKVVADGFTVKTTRSAPSGHEEFELRFRQLVEAAKTKRLVVFVDELDRCSPQQVASVLETLKTFLFVKGCVFVVAADQQVLEQALRREVRQHTPEDGANPYYSAGSSYLDKVFQYQVVLPPLKSTSLSRFALRLVADLPGVWGRIPNLDEVVSVLIPTHVVSPRRVKVLLNRYALAYRLAERRAAAGRLGSDVGGRATELAKLVCLQSEFPLFAEDLTLDARMPELVRMAADGEDLPETVREDVKARAEGYAHSRRLVAELLVEPSAEGDAADIGKGAATAGRGNGDTRGEDVARHHAQQLLAYLRKTRDVGGPGPDLLFLESAGADHGVDAIRAEELNRAATNNDITEVLRLMGDVADTDQAIGALLVLSDVVRQDQPGLEGRNAASALLRALDLSGVQLGEHAGYMADAVGTHLHRTELTEADLPGALRLASESGRDAGRRLLDAVVEHPRSVKNPDVARSAFRQLAELPKFNPRAAALATVAMLTSPGPVAATFGSLPIERVKGLLDDVMPELEARVAAHYEAQRALEQGLEPGVDAVLPQQPETSLGGLFDTLSDVEQKTELMSVMLDLDEEALRDAVFERISEVAPIRDTSLASKLLAAVGGRATEEWSEWLSALEPSAVLPLKNAPKRVDRLAQTLWLNLNGYDEWPDHAASAVESLGELARGLGETAGGDTVEAVTPALATEFLDAESSNARGKAWSLARLFVSSTLLDAGTVADLDLAGVEATLEHKFTSGTYPVQPAGPPASVHTETLSAVRRSWADASSDSLQAVSAAVDGATWLLPREALLLRLLIAAGLRLHDELAREPLGADELAELARDAEADAMSSEALAVWIRHYEPRPASLWAVLAAMAGRVPDEVSKAVSQYVATLPTAEHRELTDYALGDLLEGIDAGLLEALRVPDVGAGYVADALIDAYKRAKNLTHRRRVVDAWTVMKPTNPAVVERLVRAVYVPLAGSGDGGFDLALANFDLVSSVRGMRTDVTEALRRAAKKDSQKTRLERRLDEAGWRSQKPGLLSRRRGK